MKSPIEQSSLRLLDGWRVKIDLKFPFSIHFCGQIETIPGKSRHENDKQGSKDKDKEWRKGGCFWIRLFHG